MKINISRMINENGYKSRRVNGVL